MAKNQAKPRQPGAGKQFGGKTAMGVGQKKATAAMSGTGMPGEGPQKSIARKDAKKNTVRAGGRNVF
jgi:hypothetical protein